MSIRLRGVEFVYLVGQRFAHYFAGAIVFLLVSSATADEPNHAFSPELPEHQISATPIDSVIVEPGNTRVGTPDVHRIRFSIQSSLLLSARFRITYPKGFGFASLSSATYLDNDASNTDPKVSGAPVFDGQSVNIYLDTSGSSPQIGSLITLDLIHVRNDTIKGDYHIVLEILSPDSTLLFGPTLSKGFTVTPGIPDSLAISPKTLLTLDAGQLYNFTTIAFDQYNNRIESPSVSYSVVPAFLGTISPAGAFLPQKTGNGRIYTSYGIIKDSTNVFTVRSGPLATWDVTGFPPSGIAGESLGTGLVVVRALDAYGNLKRTTSTGLIVHFDATDPMAVFPPPYTFQAADEGAKSFQLSNFKFLRAGADTIVITNDTVFAKRPIYINSAPAATFTLVVPESTLAGQSFAINVTDGRDLFGNLAGGVVGLSLNPSDSLSPDGLPALLSDVSVANGSGSASGLLYRAGRYPIIGRIGDSIVISDSVTVMPADPGRFVWDISSPQITGQQFSDTATLRAYDPWGNLATNYDPVAPVMLSASNGDGMSNAVLSSGTFSGGVADLTNRGVTYNGRGGQVRFLADNGTASGLSDFVNVLSVTLDALNFDQTTVRRGADTLTGTIIVSIAGTGVFDVTSLQLISTAMFPLSNVTPSLPSSVVGPGSSEFVFRWPVPVSLPEGCMDFSAVLQGAFGADTASSNFSGGPCINITSSAALSVNSVSPTQVAYGGVDYWISLVNNGPLALTLELDDLIAVITDSSGRSDTAASVSTGQMILPIGTDVSLQVAAEHSSAFDGDSAYLSLVVVGAEIGQPFSDTIPFGPLHFAEPATLSYVVGSLFPDTLVRGRADTVIVRIANTGGTDIDSLSSELTYLRLGGTQDTATLRSVNLIAKFEAGTDTTLRFVISADDSRMVDSKFSPVLVLSGRQNNRSFARTLALADTVTLVGPGQVRIDSVWMVSPNAPYVTTLQNFTVFAAITNTGLEPLDSILLRLAADDGALFIDTVSVASLNPDQTATAPWAVMADAAPAALETFTVDVIRAVGASTFASATVEPALDAQTSVQVQSPAALGVEVEILSPPSAGDLRVPAGSEFVVSARFENSGQAQTGTGQLELILSGGLTTTDPAIVTVAQGANAAWNIQAPSSEGSVSATVRFASVPLELNTGVAAGGGTARDSLLMDIVFEAPPLVIRNVQYDSGMVDDEFVPVRWQWHNEDGTGSFPILIQSLEFELLSASGSSVLDAGTLIQSAELRFSNDTIAGSFVVGRLHFGTDSLRRVAPGDSESVSLSVVLKAGGTLQEFRLATRATLWRAIERSSGGSALAVAILDDRGLPLELRTPLAFQPGDVPTNFPNPFRAGLESTQIQYRLNSNASVDLVLYATSGREVWRFHADAGALGGQAGANTVLWNGLNTNGDLVLDGVYIAKLSGGLEGTLKIVVVK